MTDTWHMHSALSLARRNLGRVWPNPAVGCVIVDDDGCVRGRGWTAPGGRPHAETMALGEAGDAAKGATAYITLEPCTHHGLTGPCADALIAAGIKRAVIALEDPDTRVNGQGIARMRDAGIDVETGLMAPTAARLNAGFISRITKARPLVTLKVATSLDGHLATAAGKSRWITGELARARGHLLRARYDAILVGAGTVRADDPILTCRLPGLEDFSPVRVILDANATLSPGSEVFRSADKVPTWLVVAAETEDEKLAPYRDEDVEILKLPAAEGRVDPTALAAVLADRGVTRLLIEGGSRVTTAFMAARLVDRVVWFRAPRVIGGDGLAAIGALGVKALSQAPRFKRIATMAMGEDMMEYYDIEAWE